LELTDTIDTIQADNTTLSAQIAILTQQTNKLDTEFNKLKQATQQADKADRGEERIRYELSPEERNLVERVVMAEAADEPYKGQMLVCQCILNACENLNKRPVDIVRIYKYAKGRPEPSDSVKQAVEAVFDKGEIAESERIIYFYAPALVESEFHESKRFVCAVGGHKFFAEE
jgi:spore germination cell wall hydrolase CwlJ-like protein